MGVVVGVHGSYVSPVGLVASSCSWNLIEGEVVSTSSALVHKVRDDVPTHVVVRIWILAITLNCINQRLRVEDVVSHRNQSLGWISRHRLRVAWLLSESRNLDRVSRIYLDNAKLRSNSDWLPDCSDGCLHAGFDVRLQHLIKVHSINVVGTDHNHVVGPLIAESVHGLQNRVRTAGIPALAQTLLRRHRSHIRTQQR